jgi:AbrB family looped-hinge helix DNA binding protein
VKVAGIQPRKKKKSDDEMELIKVRRNFQLTIPRSLRRKVELAIGDYVEIDVRDGAIVIKPVKVVRSGKARTEAYAALDEIWEKMKDEQPKEVEKLVDDAIGELRKG